MPKPRRGVRRFSIHSRAIVLPDTRPAQSGPSDPVTFRGPAFPDRPLPPIEVGQLPRTEKRICAECGRSVKFNLGSMQFYSHHLPGTTTMCSNS